MGGPEAANLAPAVPDGLSGERSRGVQEAWFQCEMSLNDPASQAAYGTSAQIFANSSARSSRTWRAASLSLISSAFASSAAKLIPVRRQPAAVGSDLSFSYGVIMSRCR